MIRVAFFIDTFNIGGAETVALNLARQLLDEPGYQPMIIHFDSQAIAHHCQKFNIPQLIAPARKYYKKTLTLPIFAWKFFRFLKKHNINVLHSHLFGPVIASAPATWLGNIRHIGTLHDTYTIDEKPARIHLLRLATLLNTQLITVSAKMEDYYRSQASFPTASIITIYNGVSLEAYKGISRKLSREMLQLRDNDIVITCVARIVPLKRHDVLFRAIKLLNDAPIRLLVVGEGPERHKLGALSKSLELEEVIIFLGERNDVPTLLAASDIFTLTSDTEGLSCSILEAMGAGLPIVATNVGGNPELVSENENGFLVDKNSPDLVASRLHQLIIDPEMRKSFSNASLRIAHKRFAWAKTFESYKNLYRET